MGAGGKRTALRACVVHALYDAAFVVVFVLTCPYLLVQLLLSKRYRAGLWQRLSFLPPRARRACLWVHGVSVGEVRTAQPLVEKLEALYPQLEVVISTTTMAGQAVARRLFPSRYVFYFPLDFGPVVRRVVRRLNPRLIVLMELEIWPNLLYVAHRRGVSVLIANGRLSERSHRGYHRLRFFLPELDLVDFYSVQNETYRGRLIDLGVPAERIEVTGNLKYEALPREDLLAASPSLRRALRIEARAPVLLAGSTHPPEEEILCRIYAQLRWTFADLRLILVPRHVERVPEIERVVNRLGLECVRVTELRAASAPRLGSGPAAPVLVLDTVGELSSFYGAADVVFVGGSLAPHGGQNMMEPASLGKPVLFGPHVQNFVEDVTLLRQSAAARQIENEAELKREIAALLADEAQARELGARAKRTVRSVRGALEQNLEIVRRFLISEPPRIDEGSQQAMSEPRCG